MHDHLRLRLRAWRYRARIDRLEIAFLRRTIKRGWTVLDIGAHKGAYSYWMTRAVGANGRVIAFEPQPTLVKILQHTIARASSPRVDVHWAGVSSTSGTLTLHVPAGGPSPGASLESGKHTASHDMVDVPVVTLDAFCAQEQIPCVDFIKCDVEGHELEVFRGAHDTLQHHHPVLLFECEQRHRAGGTVSDVFEYLQQLGYEGRFFTAHGLLPIAQFDPAVHQADRESNYCNNFVFSYPNRTGDTKAPSSVADA